MTGRRGFLGATVASAITSAWPAIAQSSTFRIAWIAPGTKEEGQPLLDALSLGLRELGYVEGRNLAIEAFWGDHSNTRVTALAGEMVAAKPQVIVTLGPTAQPVSRATATIPIVFAFSGDPIQAGFVKSFAHPGGNLTGISFLALELVGKRIEFLKAMMPGLKRIAIVANSQHPGDQAERRASEDVAKAMGLEVEYFEAAGVTQLRSALDAIPKTRCEAVVMFPIQSIISNSGRIAAWSLKHRIPAVSGWAQFAEEGNLLSYGARVRETFQRIATYVDRILKGAKPGELPVELPLYIELVINLKTARALDIVVPRSVILRADKVIE